MSFNLHYPYDQYAIRGSSLYIPNSGATQAASLQAQTISGITQARFLTDTSPRTMIPPAHFDYWKSVPSHFVSRAVPANVLHDVDLNGQAWFANREQICSVEDQCY